MNKEENLKLDLVDAINLKEELRRTSVSFRLAARHKMMLVELSEKTGVTVANIVEAAITDYLNSRNFILSPADANKGKEEIWDQLKKLGPKQIYRLLTIHLRRTNDSHNFESDTGINTEASGFIYYNSAALIEIFKAYFKTKKLSVPRVELLIKDASEGYKIAAFGSPRLVKMQDEELKQILLALNK